MKYLAFDLSTVSTGWALIDSSGKLISSGVIEAKGEIQKRIHSIYQAMSVLIYDFKPDVIVAEEWFVIKSTGQNIISLGAIHGALMLLCERENKKLNYINNKTWKKHIGGGNASKEQTVKMIKLLYGKETRTSDEADAIGIAHGWLAELRFENTIGKKRRVKKW